MRWTASRKADVLADMAAHPEQSVEIMKRHNLSAEEATEWLRAEAAQGREGLRVKAIEGRRLQMAAR